MFFRVGRAHRNAKEPRFAIAEEIYLHLGVGSTQEKFSLCWLLTFGKSWWGQLGIYLINRWLRVLFERHLGKVVLLEDAHDSDYTAAIMKC